MTTYGDLPSDSSNSKSSESTSVDSGVRRSRIAGSTRLKSSRLRGVESGVAATLVGSQTRKMGHCMSRMPESCEVVQEFPAFAWRGEEPKTRRIFRTSQMRVTTPTCTASAKSACPTPARVGGEGAREEEDDDSTHRRGCRFPVQLPTAVFRTASSARRGPRHDSRIHLCCMLSFIHPRPTSNADPLIVDVSTDAKSPPTRTRAPNSTSTVPLLQPAPPDGRASTSKVQFYALRVSTRKPSPHRNPPVATAQRARKAYGNDGPWRARQLKTLSPLCGSARHRESRLLQITDTQPQPQRVASSLRTASSLMYAAQISDMCPKAADSCADRHGRGSDAVFEYAAVETAGEGEEEDKIAEKTATIRV
ncbi:hypothetical protein C8R44DRAFT_754767 [Mycena epipterygia]|nr:hypothetical protein C8R44DRAFT_754767 [Mycena epipterygia]